MTRDLAVLAALAVVAAAVLAWLIGRQRRRTPTFRSLPRARRRAVRGMLLNGSPPGDRDEARAVLELARVSPIRSPANHAGLVLGMASAALLAIAAVSGLDMLLRDRATANWPVLLGVTAGFLLGGLVTAPWQRARRRSLLEAERASRDLLARP